MNELDWNLLRVFSAVAQTGSLTRAAHQLRSSQPTVGRQVRALEDALGVALIARHGRGIRLTAQGEELAAAALPIKAGVHAFTRLAAGAREELTGTVRIGATEIVGTHVLARILAEMRGELPGIDIELDLDNRTADLLRGEVDIAVRMAAPTHLDLVGRRVGSAPTGLFASSAYFERAGTPETLDALLAHDLIGFDGRGAMADLYAKFDARLTWDRFSFRTDSLVAQLEAARAGAGIAGLQLEIASRYPELVRVLADLEIPPMPVWIVTHGDLRTGAHIRAVFHHIGDALAGYYCSDANTTGQPKA
jgi:DNA-binding transcriptional LysR family regulator